VKSSETQIHTGKKGEIHRKDAKEAKQKRRRKTTDEHGGTLIRRLFNLC